MKKSKINIFNAIALFIFCVSIILLNLNLPLYVTIPSVIYCSGFIVTELIMSIFVLIRGMINMKAETKPQEKSQETNSEPATWLKNSILQLFSYKPNKKNEELKLLNKAFDKYNKVKDNINNETEQMLIIRQDLLSYLKDYNNVLKRKMENPKDKSLNKDKDIASYKESSSSIYEIIDTIDDLYSTFPRIPDFDKCTAEVVTNITKKAIEQHQKIKILTESLLHEYSQLGLEASIKISEIEDTLKPTLKFI